MHVELDNNYYNISQWKINKLSNKKEQIIRETKLYIPELTNRRDISNTIVIYYIFTKDNRKIDKKN